MKRIICFIILALPAFVSAEEIRVVEKLNIGYKLKIDTTPYRAMPETSYNTLIEKVTGDAKAIELLEAQVNKLKQELNNSLANAAKYQDALTEQANLNTQYRDLNDSYKKLNTDYSKTAGALVKLNKDYSSTIEEFDELVEKYRKVAVRTHPRSKLDFGLGILNPTSAGSSSHYFAMAGTGAKLLNTEFRGWLMVGNDSYGAMVGLSF